MGRHGNLVHASPPNPPATAHAICPLAAILAPGRPLARDVVRALHDALVSSHLSALAHWKISFGKWAGRAIDKLPRELAKLAKRYGIAPIAAVPEAPLFALQTYYGLVGHAHRPTVCPWPRRQPPARQSILLALLPAL